jgi:dihydrolipoamide dehydrogenase
LATSSPKSVRNAKRFGIDAGPPQVDLAAVVARSRGVADQLSGGVKHLLKKNAVTVATGVGRLAGAGIVSVEADGESIRIEASHIILATGARARQLPGVEISDDIIVTYKGALRPTTIPGELLVVGSGSAPNSPAFTPRSVRR